MTAPVQLWVDPQQVSDYLGADAPAPDDTVGQAQLASQTQAATELLYGLSGRQYPGTLSAEVRPTAKPEQVHDSMWVRNLSYTYGSNYSGWNSGLLWGGCVGCNYRGCSGPYMIGLGRSPIVSVEEVNISGVVLDPSEYRVDDAKWLIRQDCSGWPTCQNMYARLGDSFTFGVNFTFGQAPPISGQNACIVLAAEMYRGATPSLASSCALPKRVSSITRQGVSIAVLDSMSYLRDGFTGISSIDMFIKAFNPTKQIRKPMVFSPDMVNLGRRQTWP